MSLGSVLIISPNSSTTELLEKTLGTAAEVTVFGDLQQAFDYIYNNVPDLLIYDFFEYDDSLHLLKTLKDDPFFAHLPVLVVLRSGQEAPEWISLPVEDYIRYEEIGKDICLKVGLCIIRSQRVVEVNPLTRLLGNISINRQIQSRLDNHIPFALAYADIDHFKPFNDKYGFSRGDDVIKIVGRLLFNIVTNKSSRDVFVGHIGGDDFVCIMDPLVIEETCQELINTFDRIVPSFYNVDDRQAGQIQSLSREGKIQTFPIMSLSIGIAVAQKGVFCHYGEVTSLASEMKNYAKKQDQSCYRLNKRAISPP